MGCNSIFTTIVGDPPCHLCLFTVKKLGWSMPGWKQMKNLYLSTWRNCKMYRQRRVLFGYGFVCLSIQKTPRCWGVLRWTLRKSQRVCCHKLFFCVLRKEKHIAHQTSRQQSPLPSSNVDPWKRWETHWVWANFNATNPLGHPKWWWKGSGNAESSQNAGKNQV